MWTYSLKTNQNITQYLDERPSEYLYGGRS